MNSTSGHSGNRSEDEVFEVVYVAHRLVVELLQMQELLEQPDVPRLADAILRRLRGALVGYSRFLEPLNDLEPIDPGKHREKGKTRDRAVRLRTHLAVMRAVSRSFLELYGLRHHGRMGFVDVTGD